MVDWSPAPGDVTRDPAREVLWERELASWKVWVHNMPKFYDLAVSPDQRTIDEGDGGIFRATIPSLGETGESGTVPLYA